MKVVTVGTSLITELLIQGFKEVGIEVFACVGRDEKRVQAFATKNEVPYHASEYDKVLQSPLFDTIYLGIPNSLHYEYAKKALLAGKNVIVEKPFTTNLKQAKELALIAKSKDVFVFDANITPHNAAFRILKSDIRMLGQIRMVEIDYSKYSSKYDSFLSGETPNIFNPDYAGGALMDLGVYNIEFVCALFGLPKTVKYYPNIQRNIDTSGVSILTYDGFIVTSVACKDANKGSFVNILGEKGNIYIPQDNSTFNSYTIELNNGTVVERKFGKLSKYYQELVDFKSMFDYHNIQKNYEYLTITLMATKVLDELRKSCGLRFKGDV